MQSIKQHVSYEMLLKKVTYRYDFYSICCCFCWLWEYYYYVRVYCFMRIIMYIQKKKNNVIRVDENTDEHVIFISCCIKLLKLLI